MADYAALQSAIETAITSAGLVVAPSGPNPEQIPAQGAGSWVAILMEPEPGFTASGGRAREAHQCALSGIVAITADRNQSTRTALDFALSLREVLDSGSALSSAYAHAVPEGYAVEAVEGRFVCSATFTINATTTIG